MRPVFLGLLACLLLAGCTSTGGGGEGAYMQYASGRCVQTGAELGTVEYGECMNAAAARYRAQASANPPS